jgi:hypothetical protein
MDISLLAAASFGPRENEAGCLRGQFDPIANGHELARRRVMQSAADAKPKNFRIPLGVNVCKSCGNAEYACICDELRTKIHSYSLESPVSVMPRAGSETNRFSENFRICQGLVQSWGITLQESSDDGTDPARINSLTL